MPHKGPRWPGQGRGEEQVAGQGKGSSPLLTRPLGPGPVECHPGHRAWLARAHRPPANLQHWGRQLPHHPSRAGNLPTS